MEKALVVVHPGSTCGSADFNLGGIPAAMAREKLAKTLYDWNGKVLVIDGSLSDELEIYATPALALIVKEDVGLLERTMACAMTTERWLEKATQFITERVKNETQIVITGAWQQKDDRQGCVDAVHQKLTEQGYMATISPCALEM